MPILKKFFNSKKYKLVTEVNRNSKGGNIFFRPIGFILMTEVIQTLSKSYGLEKSIEMASALPQELDQIPYRNVLWNPAKGIMINGGKAITRRLLLHMLNEEPNTAKLKTDYRKYMGANIVLPTPL